jgi:hypothetical protein
MAYNQVMETFKCWVPSGGTLRLYEGINHEGALWIVPMWLEDPSDGWKRPAYMIRISGLEFEDRSIVPGVQFALKTSIPKEVLEGNEAADEFEIRKDPDIRIPLPAKAIH